MCCPAQPHAPPQARARGPDAPGSPADVVASCMPCNFIRCRQRAVLSTGGEGLRSPPPCRSGKAPTAVAAAFLPPLVARTSKALSVGAELPASGSSSGKPGERAGAAGAAGAGGECGGSQWLASSMAAAVPCSSATAAAMAPLEEAPVAPTAVPAPTSSGAKLPPSGPQVAGMRPNGAQSAAAHVWRPSSC